MKTNQLFGHLALADRVRSADGSNGAVVIGRPARRSAAAVLLAAASLLLGGCTLLPQAPPDLTRYYVLTAVTPQGETRAEVGDGSRVFLRGVTVPEFLRGRIMQVRVAENELRFIDEARWAEPLEAGVLRVIRDDLERSATVRVVDHGGEPHEFEVAVQLRRCEGVLPGGSARLAARIEIRTVELEPKLVAQEEFITEIPGWDGEDHGELAGKLSEAVARLSQRIAELIPVK